MKPIVTSSLAALAAGLILGGCAVAPVDGPYANGYARPYYYDNGPVYYGTYPGYYYGYYPGYHPDYYYYGPPAVVGSFSFGGGDHHWSGGSWHNDSLNSGDQTRARTFRAQTTARTFHAPRASTPRSSTASRARANRMAAHRDSSDKS
jgi:hypothetical protein